MITTAENRSLVENMITNHVGRPFGREKVVQMLADSYATCIADEIVAGGLPDPGTVERYAILAAELAEIEAQ